LDDKGNPITTQEVSFEIRHPAWSEPFVEDHYSQGGGISELRIAVRGPGRLSVAVRVPGYEKAVVDGVEVDANGQGEVEVRLKPGKGGLPVRHPIGLRQPKAKSEALEKIRSPDKSSKEDVRRYVMEILATVGNRSSFATLDPEVAMLADVGPDHVDVLLEVLRSEKRPHFTGDNYLEWALGQIVEERHRQLLLEALDAERELIDIVAEKGWARDARETLIAALQPNPSYLPTGWIKAVASFRDPATYPALLRYLVEGSNPSWTHDAIKDLPGIEVKKAVDEGWPRAKGTHEQGQYARVAVQYGHVDALGILIEALFIPQSSPNGIWGARDAVLWHIDFQGSDEEIRAWFKANRDALVFDPKTGKYAPEQ
ncbi:MAG: carboxypeptidase-like regulatory domain-containing protein, partial [Planctomycetota bacterium]